MIQPKDYFSASYSEARAKFLEAVKDAGLAHEVFVHPAAKGPDGGGLFVDVARHGADNPSTVILTCSGTHGVEGFAGSAGQTSVIREKLLATLPADVAVVHVHGINPYGFAHVRRVNEDNIDLNRNFIDFTAPRPAEDPLTEAVRPLLLPEVYVGPGRLEHEAKVDAFIAQHGLRSYQRAITRGQYRFADSLYYGGMAPSWSNQIWREIVRRHCAHKPVVLHVDVHSGLGPYGYGELIYSDPRTTLGFKRAQALWGDSVTCSADGSSTSVQLSGDIEQGVKDVVGFDNCVSVTLEFGTVPIREVLESLIADNWLHIKGQMGTPLAAQIKRQLRYCFYGEEPVWQSMVVGRIQQVLEQARDGLARGMASAA
jgi:Protein of unknown function (DUF2817)